MSYILAEFFPLKNEKIMKNLQFSQVEFFFFTLCKDKNMQNANLHLHIKY